MIQIGEVATRVGLSLRTLRHWDEVGLVVPSARSVGGFRLYTETDVERLALVKTLKPLDLSLDEMRELLATTDAAGELVDPGQPDELVDRLDSFRAAADRRAEVLRGHVAGLETLSGELDRLATACRQRAATRSSSTRSTSARPRRG